MFKVITEKTEIMTRMTKKMIYMTEIAEIITGSF